MIWSVAYMVALCLSLAGASITWVLLLDRIESDE